MPSEVDFSHTATGILGTHRDTMLKNILHLRPQLGRALKRGYNLPGSGFTYGRPNICMDGGTAYAMSGWSCHDESQQPARVYYQERSKTADGRIREGTTDQGSRGKDGKTRQQQKNRRIPPSTVFGIKTRPSTPVFDLLEHRYQDRWMEERRSALLAKQQKEKSNNRTGKVYDTRASLLRNYEYPVENTDLWQLPKFTRHATPALNTFRTERSRTAAYRNHQYDRISRKGSLGHGIYASY